MFGSLVAAAGLAVGVFAQTQHADISVPNPNWWWVADSVNLLTWTCNTLTASQFSIALNNPDVNILPSYKVVKALHPNADCSSLLDVEVIGGLTPAQGYFVTFLNPVNQTDIWATSQPFEIRPAGSTYPQTSSSAAPNPTGSNSGTGTSTSTSTSTPNNNSASSYRASAAAAMLGLVALGMTVLA